MYLYKVKNDLHLEAAVNAVTPDSFEIVCSAWDSLGQRPTLFDTRLHATVNAGHVGTTIYALASVITSFNAHIVQTTKL